MTIADFNLDEEYQETPLYPNGEYNGTITNVSMNTKETSMDFTVHLNNNGGFLSDGTTMIDGTTLTYYVFIPQEEDKNRMTSSGRQTSYQWKVNSMKKFFAKNFPNVPMSTKADMDAALGSRILCTGVNVRATVVDEEYNGVVSSKVKDLKVVA
jgi:hypothetical protein